MVFKLNNQHKRVIELKVCVTACLPSYQQFFNFRLPHEQHEDNEALNAVEEVADVENPRRHENPRDGLHHPRRPHHDEQAEVQEEPKRFDSSSLISNLKTPSVSLTCPCRRRPSNASDCRQS